MPPPARHSTCSLCKVTGTPLLSHLIRAGGLRHRHLTQGGTPTMPLMPSPGSSTSGSSSRSMVGGGVVVVGGGGRYVFMLGGGVVGGLSGDDTHCESASGNLYMVA